MRVPVPTAGRPYTDAALLRLRYLYPRLIFEVTDDGAIDFQGFDETEATNISREVLYAVYREKIYSETLTMRRALIDTVTGS